MMEIVATTSLPVVRLNVDRLHRRRSCQKEKTLEHMKEIESLKRNWKNFETLKNSRH